MKVGLQRKFISLPVLVSLMLLSAADFGFVSYLNLANKPAPITSEPVIVKKKSAPVEEEPATLGAAIPEPVREPQPVVSGSKAPVIGRIITSQPVVFLTIDDGAVKNSNMLSLLQSYNIKASLFLDNKFIANNYSFFTPFLSSGMYIENHGLNHIYDKPGTVSYDTQHYEICGMADKIEQVYGRRPTLFRPPGGYYDTNTQVAAAACGMRAVVMWIAKANGGAMQYQVGSSLRSGDIVLMHFREEFASDLAAFVAAQNAAGLHTEYLEDWL